MHDSSIQGARHQRGLWTAQGENKRGVRGMTWLDIFQIVFVATVFIVGLGGIIKAVFIDKD